MNSLNTFERMYKQVNAIVDFEKAQHVGFHLKKESSAFMPLIIETIESNDKYFVLSFAHYYEQNGDLMADPEMTIRVYKDDYKIAEALTFRQDGVFSCYQEVYPKPGFINLKLRNALNAFLKMWLSNLKKQGFAN